MGRTRADELAHCAQVPHYVTWINILRGGLNAVLAWVSLVTCVLSFTVEWEWDHGHPIWHQDEYRRMMTVVCARARLAGRGSSRAAQ